MKTVIGQVINEYVDKNLNRFLDRLKKVISIPSYQMDYNEKLVALEIADYLKDIGLEPVIEEVLEDRPNVISRIGGLDNSLSPLILNAHMDTVPPGDYAAWEHDPLAGDIHNGRLYGRGAIDDKGGLITQVSALETLKAVGVDLNRSVLFSAVMGEETGHLGTKAWLKGLMAEDREYFGAIVGEWSGAGRIAVGYRGVLILRIEVFGRSAHGGRPSQGNNAIEKTWEYIIPLIDSLLSNLPETEYKIFEINNATRNIGKIRGGIASNTVADYCETYIDIRLMPDQRVDSLFSLIDRGIEEICRKHTLKYNLDIINNKQGFCTDDNTQLVNALADSIEDMTGKRASLFGKIGCSDANLFASELRIPTVAYGPGNTTAHSPNEFVEINDFKECIKVYAYTIASICC